MTTTKKHTDERVTAADFAGHCSESTAWQILKEMSGQLLESKQGVFNPYLVKIGDNGHFSLTASDTQANGFDAHEIATESRPESATVWSLGASLFYIVMGRQVMNGKGGNGQTPTSRLPYIRSEWPALSELVQQCLQYAPEKRPSLKDVYDTAKQNHERCLNDIKRGPKFKPAAQTQAGDGTNKDKELAFWPETM